MPALVLGLASLRAGGTPRALGQPASGEVTPQTDAAVPAHEVVMLGAAPEEAPDETWGIGKVGAQSQATWAIVRYTSETGWTLASPMLDGSGAALSGFVPAESQLAGSIAADGSGALLGSVPGAKEPRQVLLVRDPGHAFIETSSEAPLEKGQHLFDPQKHLEPMIAALEEGGSAGALVVPVASGSAPEVTSVLHWSDGARAWTSEPIEIPKASREAGGFEVLAIAASYGDAWLLAKLQGESSSLALFRREEGAHGAVWQPVAPGPSEPAGAALQVPLKGGGSTPMVAEGAGGQPLTVSAKKEGGEVRVQGVWIDGTRSDTLAPMTMFFKPESADSGTVLASWCAEPVGAEPCTNTLSEELRKGLSEAFSLPNGPSRSFAWADFSEPFGQRVITGLNEGVSLRLNGATFNRVLALGSSEASSVGASHGAAFADPTEGWLGTERLPVHLTLSPEEDLLQSYPVPFRHPLLAIAPQPGAPVGALTSEAIAVGEGGEVARFAPTVGWLPESLLNVAGERQTPQLRAVAWPAPSRIYAVGTAGQMWLWRAETDLWEKDPATPVNFRGDLLGIAFDPEDTSRGYAVGQGGVLLRYGKTWTQEPTCEAGVPEPCLPAEVAGTSFRDASFTSVAFAGSEAIVAYRVPHFTVIGQTTSFSYTGGLLINNGAGWQVDASAATALAGEAQDIPWAVAGLPEGGAAFSAESAAGVPRVFERNAAGASWEATAQPYPGYSAPGALALFREGGALRVIGSGAVPETARADEQTPPPAGFPPALIRPYPLARAPAFIFRQTASGWSEEEHNHDEAGPPEGNYTHYDKGFEPDPNWAVLIGPTGSSGWAVGGFPKEEGGAGLETADIARYAYPSAESTPPPGVTKIAPPLEPHTTALAVGGGAQCGAPCAARADARIGPDAGLSTAIKQAQASGAQAFIDTGPRLTTGATLVKATLRVPYADELARYAELLGAGGPGFAYAAATSADDVQQEGQCLFKTTFEQFSFEPGEPTCSAYYSFLKAGAGGTVRVIVLDDDTAVQADQLKWLGEQLTKANEHEQAAIVVGNADLNAQEERGENGAVVDAIVAGKASAYLFDAPEQNLTLKLRGSEIPAYGSGTLGYVSVQNSELPEFIGAGGFLLTQVGSYEQKAAANKEAEEQNKTGHHEVRPNAEVTAELIPTIGEGEHGREGELSLEAQQGTLLRRSQVAAFAGLARRPRAGNEASGENEGERFSYTFTPIPANCVGTICEEGITPAYSFTSSNEEVARFVEPELSSAEPNAIKFNSKEEPIFEEKNKSAKGLWESSSGLLCALNPGKTNVTINAGGFSATLPVTVEAGSVRRPCGTVPAKHPPAQEQQVGAPATPPAATTPATAPASAPPILPVPPPPSAAAPPPARPARPLPPFFLQTLPPLLLPAIVPPPLPAPANPTPPSGTSAVTSPVEAAQKEEEQEEATESVSNQAVAYRAPDHEPAPAYLLGIVLLAAFAGASGWRRTGRGRREVRVAPATLSSSRSQRRLQDGDWRRRR